MANYCMLLASSCMAGITSWASNRCWAYTMTYRTGPSMPPRVHTPISNGGSSVWSAPKSSVHFPTRPSFETSAPTQTPTRESALGSSSRHSVTNGSAGRSRQTGQPRDEISLGLKPSASNYWSAAYNHIWDPETISSHTVTTQASSKAGATSEAVTKQSTSSSAASLTLLTKRASPSIPSMSPAKPTRRMAHRGGAFPTQSALLSRRPCQRLYHCSSVRQMTRATTPRVSRHQPYTTLRTNSRMSTNFSSHTNNAGIGNGGSLLRPDCPTHARIAQWLPAPSLARTLRDAEGAPLPLSITVGSDLDWHLSNTWQLSTLTTYSSGLQAYHQFCDSHHLSDRQRAPASPDLIAAFISHLIGTVTASTVSNYVAGLCAWHFQHRLPWLVNEREYHLLLRSAAAFTPASSTRLARSPYTVPMIQAILMHMDLSSLLHVAAAACLVVTFYTCVSRTRSARPTYYNEESRDRKSVV